MALFTPGAIISEIRGSVGNEVFSRVRTGPIVRSKPVPYPATSPSQLNWQDRMRNAISAWQNLDETSRMNFINAASDRIRMQRLGYKRKMSGYSLFVSRYLLATKAGEETTIFPLDRKMTRKYQLLGIDLSVSAFELAIKNPDALASTRFSVFATAKLNPGQLSIGDSEYRLIVEEASTVSGLTVFDVSAAYETKFEAIHLTEGYRVGIGLQCFNFQSGERTALFTFNQIVNS